MAPIKERVSLQPLLRLADLAIFTDMHERTLRRAIKEGRLRCYRIGKSLRFDQEQVLDFLRSGR